jgi:hypothetical protein
VVTLPTMQSVDGALNSGPAVQGPALKAAGYDFKMDDYLTREEMQERMRMRPVQRRLQQAQASSRPVPWRAAVAAGPHRRGLPLVRARHGGGWPRRPLPRPWAPKCHAWVRCS